VELAQALAHVRLGQREELGQETGTGGRGNVLGQHRGEAPEGQRAALGAGELREVGCECIEPTRTFLERAFCMHDEAVDESMGTTSSYGSTPSFVNTYPCEREGGNPVKRLQSGSPIGVGDDYLRCTILLQKWY